MTANQLLLKYQGIAKFIGYAKTRFLKDIGADGGVGGSAGVQSDTCGVWRQ